MFGYGSSGGRLKVETTRGDIEPNGGLIQEAYLVSQVSPGAGIRHRLTLRISPDATRSIELSMPQDSTVDRIRRDGQPIVPSASGGPFRVEIPEPSPGRTSSTLTIDYETLGDLPGHLLEPALLLPRCSMPCLSFAWEIVAPDPWAVGGIASGLVETDLAPTRSTAPRRSLATALVPLDSVRAPVPRRGSEEAIRLDLDKAASELADGESNLGDWLLKLDAGKRPIVVDRLALRSAGCGPGSRIDPALDDSNSLGRSKSILQPLGLIAYSLDGVILITAHGAIPERSRDRGRLVRPTPRRSVERVGRRDRPFSIGRSMARARRRQERSRRVSRRSARADRAAGGPGGWSRPAGPGQEPRRV